MLPFVVTGVALGSLYALSGVGMVLLFRATGVLNLAYGGIGALAVLIAWESNQNRGVAFWPSLLVCLLVTTGLSLAWGGLVGPRLAERDAVVKATATLGLALACLGVCNWYWLDKARTLTLPSDQHVYGVAGVQISVTQTAALALAVVVTALAAWLLKVTVTGTTMRALADDRELAAMLGVRVRRTEILAWLISGLLAGVSAIYLADLTVLAANNLTFLVIPALAAAVIGRLRSLWGTLAGGIVVGLVEGLLTQYGDLSQIHSTVPFLVAIAVQLWLSRHKTYTMRTAEDRA